TTLHSGELDQKSGNKVRSTRLQIQHVIHCQTVPRAVKQRSGSTSYAVPSAMMRAIDTHFAAFRLLGKATELLPVARIADPLGGTFVSQSSWLECV
ncbi:hypothetical protein A9325_21070, partial [Yersinia pestis]